MLFGARCAHQTICHNHHARPTNQKVLDVYRTENKTLIWWTFSARQLIVRRKKVGEKEFSEKSGLAKTDGLKFTFRRRDSITQQRRLFHHLCLTFSFQFSITNNSMASKSTYIFAHVSIFQHCCMLRFRVNSISTPSFDGTLTSFNGWFLSMWKKENNSQDSRKTDLFIFRSLWKEKIKTSSADAHFSRLDTALDAT